MRRSFLIIPFTLLLGCLSGSRAWSADAFLPYTAPRMEREQVYQFTEKPKVRYMGDDKHEITFAVKAYCDVTISVLNAKGDVVEETLPLKGK